MNDNTRRLLQYHADRIEATLASHGVGGAVTGGTVTPRWIRFAVHPRRGVTVDRIRARAEDLARALEVDDVRVSRRGGVVEIEVPRGDARPVTLRPILNFQYPRSDRIH